jgi:cell division protease FtsH
VAILKVHARKIRMASDVDLDQVAAITVGFAGADLANVVNEAALVATRRNGEAVTLADFTQAIERIVAGIEKKSRVLNKEERRRVAYHEMGHALVAASLSGVDPVQKVSIVPRGVGALGYTMQRPTEDRFLLTMGDLQHRIAVLMGGRAAERLIFGGEISTGAADDLQRATEIAMEMVTKFGMDPSVGNRIYAPAPQPFLGVNAQDRLVSASEATSREIDLAVRRLVEQAAGLAQTTLQERRDDLEAGALLLLEKETVTAADFEPLRRARGERGGPDDLRAAPPPEAAAHLSAA